MKEEELLKWVKGNLRIETNQGSYGDPSFTIALQVWSEGSWVAISSDYVTIPEYDQ